MRIRLFYLLIVSALLYCLVLNEEEPPMQSTAVETTEEVKDDFVKDATKNKSKLPYKQLQTSSSMADSILSLAYKLQGTPYCYGCMNPEKGFDCSGFVHYVFKQFDIGLARSSANFVNFGVKVPKEKAQKGDIILFAGTDGNTNRIGHVGIIANTLANGLPFIHASSSKKNNGVVVTKYAESKYYQKRFIQVIRVLPNTPTSYDRLAKP